MKQLSLPFIETGKMEEFQFFFDSDFKFGVPPFAGLHQIGRNSRGSCRFLRKKFEKFKKFEKYKKFEKFQLKIFQKKIENNS